MQNIDYEREISALIEKIMNQSTILKREYLNVELIKRDLRTCIDMLVEEVKTDIFNDNGDSVLNQILEKTRKELGSDFDKDCGGYTFLSESIERDDYLMEVLEYSMWFHMLTDMFEYGAIIHTRDYDTLLCEVYKFIARLVCNDSHIIERVEEFIRK